MIPTVSVILPVYNAERFLAEAVESILQQSYTNLELIILNDGSTDRSHTILQRYTDPRIVYVQNKTNLGLTKTLNKGLALARGEYIARQDADDISAPTRLEKQKQFLDTHPEIHLVGNFWLNIGPHGRLLSTQRLPVDSVEIREHLLVDLVITHATVMFRKEILAVTGKYRELAGSAEDLDLWLRLAENFDLCNIPEFLYSVRIHGDSVVGAGLNRHLESVYTVRKLALDRWQQTGRALSPPRIIARARLIMACQDLMMGRSDEGELNLCRAQEIFPPIRLSIRQNAADIAQMALYFCRISSTSPDIASWRQIGIRYIALVLSHLPSGWSMSSRKVLAQFFATLSFQAYASEQYSTVVKYALQSCVSDPYWIQNRGLWRIGAYALLKRNDALSRG